jgi:hypothetical protein
MDEELKIVNGDAIDAADIMRREEWKTVMDALTQSLQSLAHEAQVAEPLAFVGDPHVEGHFADQGNLLGDVAHDRFHGLLLEIVTGEDGGHGGSLVNWLNR